MLNSIHITFLAGVLVLSFVVFYLRWLINPPLVSQRVLLRVINRNSKIDLDNQ